MWLVARLTTNGHDTVARFTRGRTPEGNPRFEEVEALLGKHGYDVAMGLRKYDRAQWPLLVIAYRSRNKDGIGRAGGPYMTFIARKRA